MFLEIKVLSLYPVIKSLPVFFPQEVKIKPKRVTDIHKAYDRSLTDPFAIRSALNALPVPTSLPGPISSHL